MKDLHSGMLASVALATAAISADNTPAANDMRGYNALELILGIGVGGITFDATNKIEFKLTHSDDDSTYTAVTADDVLGVSSVGTGGIIKSLEAAHAAAAVYRIGYVGGKRYQKLLADFSGTHGAATPLSAIWLKGKGHDNPQADQA